MADQRQTSSSLNSGITVFSYNSHASGTGRSEYISELLTSSDFVLLHEHWLHEFRFRSTLSAVNLSIYSIILFPQWTLLISQMLGDLMVVLPYCGQAT